MGELRVFNNAEFGAVRSFMVNGEPFFVGKDVKEILGYKDTADALRRHVDDIVKNTDALIEALQAFKAERL